MASSLTLTFTLMVVCVATCMAGNYYASLNKPPTNLLAVNLIKTENTFFAGKSISLVIKYPYQLQNCRRGASGHYKKVVNVYIALKLTFL